MTLSVIVLSASAYTIDSSCDAFNDLPGAIQEAIDMANYGKWRIDQATPAVGKVTNQLLGTNPVNLFKGEQSLPGFRHDTSLPCLEPHLTASVDRMQEAVNALGPHNGRWNVNNPPVDTSVVVKCGNAFLHYDQSDSSWKDPDFSQTMEGLLPYSGTPATTRPCSQASGEMARTYLTGLDDGRSPRFVMMLCDGWQNAALSKPLKFGTRWETQQWSKVPFGRFVNEGTSVTVLHEAMHCIWIRSTTHGPCEQTCNRGDARANVF